MFALKSTTAFEIQNSLHHSYNPNFKLIVTNVHSNQQLGLRMEIPCCGTEYMTTEKSKTTIIKGDKFNLYKHLVGPTN
jgi:hypothetical protein